MKNKNAFLNGNNLRKLNKQFNKFTSEDSWKNTREIVVKIKTFEQVDIVDGRRNNVSSVVQVSDKLIQCVSAYWLTGTKWTPTLYVKASCHSSHGFGSKNNVLFVFKDFKGRKDSISLYKSWNREDFLKDFPYRLLEVEKSCAEKLAGKSWDVKRRYTKMIEAVIRSELYSAMYDLERGKITEELSALLQKFGCTPIEAVPYTHEFKMYGFQGVKQSKNGFKIALKNTSTYCSLPSTLEIQLKKSSPKLLRLDKLNIETSGYYNHSEGLQIRAEHLKQAKQLQREFKNIAKGG